MSFPYMYASQKVHCLRVPVHKKQGKTIRCTYSIDKFNPQIKVIIALILDRISSLRGTIELQYWFLPHKWHNIIIPLNTFMLSVYMCSKIIIV